MSTGMNQAVKQVQAALRAGDTQAARELLDRAWTHARAPSERKVAHDLGNVIQRAIFQQYLDT